MDYKFMIWCDACIDFNKDGNTPSVEIYTMHNLTEAQVRAHLDSLDPRWTWDDGFGLNEIGTRCTDARDFFLQYVLNGTKDKTSLYLLLRIELEEGQEIKPINNNK